MANKFVDFLQVNFQLEFPYIYMWNMKSRLEMILGNPHPVCTPDLQFFATFPAIGLFARLTRRHSNRTPTARLPTVRALEATRSGFPLGLEKMESIFQSGKYEQAWKVRGKSHKILENWEFQTNVICYFWVIFKWSVCYLLKFIKFSVKKTKHKKIVEKWKKYWKS